MSGWHHGWGKPVEFVYALVTPDEGQVAYIGQTFDPPTRIPAHRRLAAWCTPDMEFALVSVHATRRAALDAEAEAIRTHRPLFNVMHNNRKVDVA